MQIDYLGYYYDFYYHLTAAKRPMPVSGLPLKSVFAALEKHWPLTEIKKHFFAGDTEGVKSLRSRSISLCLGAM